MNDATHPTVQEFYGHHLLLWLDNDEGLYRAMTEAAAQAVADGRDHWQAAESFWETVVEPWLYMDLDGDGSSTLPSHVREFMPDLGMVRDALAERLQEIMEEQQQADA